MNLNQKILKIIILLFLITGLRCFCFAIDNPAIFKQPIDLNNGTSKSKGKSWWYLNNFPNPDGKTILSFWNDYYVELIEVKRHSQSRCRIAR